MFIVLSLLLVKFDLSSQPATEPAVPVAVIEGRTTIDLTGEWKLNAISDTGSGGWAKFSVPGVLAEKGTYSIRKRIEIKSGDARTHSWKMHADKIVGKCELYCNRKHFGSIAGTGEPIDLPIPNTMLRDGINELDLQIEHHRSVRELPLSHQLYAAKTEFGILGAIWIERTSSVAIASAYATMNDQSGTVQSEIVVENAEPSSALVRLQLRILDHSSGLEIATLIDSLITIPPGLSPKLRVGKMVTGIQNWSADAPHQFEVIGTIGRDGIEVDRSTSRLGLHHATHDQQNILLNGVAQKIKSITYYEPRADSEDIRKAAIEKDLESIKLLGANCIRLPEIASEYLLERCDEVGVMVLADLPINGVAGGLAGKEDLGALNFIPTIERLGRHPSVIAVGCGAENDNSDARVIELTKKIASQVKEHSDLLTYCISRFTRLPFALDIAALSTFGINDPQVIQAATNAFAKIHGGKRPMIMASFGSFCRVERKLFMGELASMNDQSKLLSSTIKDIEAAHFAGISAMTLSDYRSDVEALAIPSSVNKLVTSGLLDPDHSLRPAARTLQTYFTGQGRISVSQNEPETESTLPFLILGFVFLLVFFLLMNLDRRFREYVKRALMRPFNFFADIRDQRLIPNAQTALLTLIIGGSWALVLGGMLYGYREHYAAGWAVAKFIPRSFQSIIVSLAWQPWLMLLFGMAFVFVVILLVAGIIRFFAIFVRGRIFYTDALNVTSWALMPSIFLAPLGMILPRLDHTQSTAMFTFVVLILLKLWLLYRLMKGVGVLFDIYPTRIYLFGSLGVAAAYLLIFLYLNATTALAANWPFFIHLTKSTTLQ